MRQETGDGETEDGRRKTGDRRWGDGRQLRQETGERRHTKIYKRREKGDRRKEI